MIFNRLPGIPSVPLLMQPIVPNMMMLNVFMIHTDDICDTEFHRFNAESHVCKITCCC